MNTVTLVGRLTKEPELKYTTSNIATCNFILAVNRPFTNQAGEREADFIPCVVWRKQAENLVNFVKKGHQVGIVGRVQTRSYVAQDNTKRFITEIVVDQVSFLETKKQSGQVPEETQFYNHENEGAYGW